VDNSTLGKHKFTELEKICLDRLSDSGLHGKSVDNSTLGKHRFTELEKICLDRISDSGLHGKSVDNSILGKHRFTKLEKNLPRQTFGFRPTWKICGQFYIGQA